jgi:hypothetical protein
MRPTSCRHTTDSFRATICGHWTTFATACLLAILAAGGPLTACAPKTIDVQAISTPQLMEEAAQVWEERRYEHAELYYGRLLDRSDLPESSRPMVLERYSRSALRSGHYAIALTGLEQWADLEPEVRDSWPWHEYYIQALAGLGRTDRIAEHLKPLMRDPDMSWKTRFEAAELLFGYHWDRQEYAQALEVKREIYDLAPNQEQREKLEQAFLDRLEDADNDLLARLDDTVNAGNYHQFPYVLVQLEAAIRLAESSPEEWPRAWQIMRRLLNDGEFTDTETVLGPLTRFENQYGLPRRGIALALPMSDKFGRIGWSILRGADIARRELLAQGNDIEIRAVNTQAPAWVQTLKDLPPYYSVVGGPLRTQTFIKARSSGLLNERAFFAFLQGLGEVEEGEEAWRFFTSLEDQARSLVQAAVETMGVEKFAILFPRERFGQRMAQMFHQQVLAHDADISAFESYPSDSPPEWGRAVGDLIGIHDPDPDEEILDSGPPPEDPDFEAVFISDGWAQAQVILPQFVFHQQDHLLLMGPELWSQAAADSGVEEAQYYEMAVCPGAFHPDSQTPGAEKLRNGLFMAGLQEADFWTALGFDFVRFASGLAPLPPDWDATDINSSLKQASGLSWAMAPMSWDREGHARQSLFLFTPTAEGLRLLDASEFAKKRTKRVEEHKELIKRYQKRLREKIKQEKELEQEHNRDQAPGTLSSR